MNSIGEIVTSLSKDDGRELDQLLQDATTAEIRFFDRYGAETARYRVKSRTGDTGFVGRRKLP